MKGERICKKATLLGFLIIFFLIITAVASYAALIGEASQHTVPEDIWIEQGGTGTVKWGTGIYSDVYEKMIQFEAQGDYAGWVSWECYQPNSGQFLGSSNAELAKIWWPAGQWDYFAWTIFITVPINISPGHYPGKVICYNYYRDPVSGWSGCLGRATADLRVHVLPYFKWLPPIKYLDETTTETYTMQEGSTLPIKFVLYDSCGNFVSDPTIKIKISGNGGETIFTYGEGDENMRIDATENYYIVNLHTKNFPWIEIGQTYTISVYFGGTDVGLGYLFSKTDFVLVEKGKAKGK